MSTAHRQPWAASGRPWGVLAPVLTPFEVSGAVDLPAFVEHCRWLVSQGVGLALFTAESETAHLSLAARTSMLDAVLAAGIAADRVTAQLPGDRRDSALSFARHALDAGVNGLMLSGPLEDTHLLIEHLAKNRHAALYLCGHAFDTAALARLLDRHGTGIAGIWHQDADRHSLAALPSKRHPLGLQVFTSDESRLAQDLARGAAGCITPLANVCPAWLARACADEDEHRQATAQACVLRAARAFRAQALRVSMRHVLAQWTERPGWQRSPTSTLPLAESELTRLMTELLMMRFDMPGLRVAA